MTPNSVAVLAIRTLTYLAHVRPAQYVDNLPAICACVTRHGSLLVSCKNALLLPFTLLEPPA